MITIEGKKYKVAENLGFQAGYYAKAVEVDGKERIAVKRGGSWVWYVPKIIITKERAGGTTINKGE